MFASLAQVVWFVGLLAAAVAALEGCLYCHFTYYDRKGFLPAAAAAALGLSLAAAWPLLGAERGLCMAFAAAAVEAVTALIFRHVVRGRHTLPVMLLAPAFIGLALLIAYPLVF